MPQATHGRVTGQLQVVTTRGFRMQTGPGESDPHHGMYATVSLMGLGAQVDMRKRFRGNQVAIMVSNTRENLSSDAYSTLLTGERAAREKEGRG